MQEDVFYDGEVAAVGVYLDKPERGKPTGEPIDLSFFLCAEDGGVISLGRVYEPYLVDWVDWKTMKAGARSESHVAYEVDWMRCDLGLDILPVEVPEVMYAVLGRVTQVGLGGEKTEGRQHPSGYPDG